MRHYNGFTAFIVILIVMMLLSTIFSFVFRFFPLILLIGVGVYAYNSYKQSKRLKEQQARQEEENVYDNFFDRQSVEDNSQATFDKEAFFNEDQVSDLKIVDAQVVEKDKE